MEEEGLKIEILENFSLNRLKEYRERPSGSVLDDMVLIQAEDALKLVEVVKAAKTIGYGHASWAPEYLCVPKDQMIDLKRAVEELEKE